MERVNTHEDIVELEDKIEGGEKVIGEVPKELRFLWSYKELLKNKTTLMIEEHDKRHRDSTDTKETCEEIVDTVFLNKNEIYLLKNIFWSSLRNELKVNTHDIGIRKGWKVVELPSEVDPISDPFLSLLLQLRFHSLLR